MNSGTAAAKEKEVEIKNTTDKDLPAIEADADKTTWVLNNLLTNAIIYSFTTNSIEVKAAQQNGAVIFSVKDYGAGIEECLPRLFERYFQGPGSKEKAPAWAWLFQRNLWKRRAEKFGWEVRSAKAPFLSFNCRLNRNDLVDKSSYLSIKLQIFSWRSG